MAIISTDNSSIFQPTIMNWKLSCSFDISNNIVSVCFCLEQLFDHIADCIGKFIRDHDLQGQQLPLGFTFSFPCSQEGLAKARLSKWTKGFRCEGVVGEDICQLLHEALKRRTVSSRIILF